MQALRTYSIDHAAFGQRLASWLSLHSTDAAALLEISDAEHRGDTVTPKRLGEKILLTSGATTSLINRLEIAGHVERTREHADRRVVTLRTTARVDALADEFFTPLQTKIDALIRRYPPEFIEDMADFLRELHTTMTAVLHDNESPAATHSP